MSRRRKLITSLLVVFVIVIAALITIIKTLSSPAVGTIDSSPTPAATSQVSKPAIKPTQFSGAYISFSYPSNYSPNTVQKSSGYLDAISLYSNDHSGKSVAVGVFRESLNNDSGVMYRQGHPDLYKQVTSSPDKLVFMKIKDGSEYTGFIAHNGLVASVSLTSTFNKDLSSDYNYIMKNWQWKSP